VVTYHEEAVSNPEAVPVVGAVRDVHVLAVDGQHVRVHLAHHASEKEENFTSGQRSRYSYTHGSKILYMIRTIQNCISIQLKGSLRIRTGLILDLGGGGGVTLA
jgi:hypothetical protein